MAEVLATHHVADDNPGAQWSGVRVHIPHQRLPRRCISPVQRESFVREMALSATGILSMRLGSTSPLLFPGSTMEHAVLPRS